MKKTYEEPLVYIVYEVYQNDQQFIRMEMFPFDRKFLKAYKRERFRVKK